MGCRGCRITDHERTAAVMCYTCPDARASAFAACTIGGLPVHEPAGDGRVVAVAAWACPRGLAPDGLNRVRWLGVRWKGVPYPRRLLLARPLRWWWWRNGAPTKPIEGCGCLWGLKARLRLARLRLGAWARTLSPAAP